MKTHSYPKASLLQIRCPSCGCERPENGGYRIRKHRDVDGVREVRVMKVRCSGCSKHLRCSYLECTPRTGPLLKTLCPC